MNTIHLVLYAVAFVCFALTAIGVHSRINLVAVGLAAWVLVPVLDTLQPS